MFDLQQSVASNFVPDQALDAPDFGDDHSQEEIELSVKSLLDSTKEIHEYLSEPELLASAVNFILFDAEDDKLGRITDLYRDAKNKTAEFVVDNLKWSSHAQWILDEANKD